jgi:hypothetical protein
MINSGVLRGRDGGIRQELGAGAFHEEPLARPLRFPSGTLHKRQPLGTPTEGSETPPFLRCSGGVSRLRE